MFKRATDAMAGPENPGVSASERSQPSAPSWAAYVRDEVQLDRLQAIVDDAIAGDRAPIVLEAGCGSASWFQFPPRCRIVGIDISREQLDRNARLSQKILGDIETFDLSASSANVVICAFVLEHLGDPSKAVQNLTRTLRPGGVMVLIAPHPFSAAGLLTKLSPHWFHVWFYRTVLGNRGAGKPGNAPFRAPMRWAIRPAALSRLATREGLEVIYARSWQDHLSWIASAGSRLARLSIGVAEATSRALSLGRWSLSKGTYAIVLRRPIT